MKRNSKPVLVVGNEGLSYAGISPIKKDLIILFQSFSLISQPRGDSKSLSEILKIGGIKRAATVGIAGWKYYLKEEINEPERRIEIPSYISDIIRENIGNEKVFNANQLLMHPTQGIRAVNDVDQLAWFEYIGSHTSQAIRDVLFNLRCGMTEHDAVRIMKLNGLTLSCHLMLSTGPRATIGLSSPSTRVKRLGDQFTVAYGGWGSLNARAGFVAESELDLPRPIRDYMSMLVAPYFEAVTSWYSRLKIGATGGELYQAIHERIGDHVTKNPKRKSYLA